MQVAAGEVTRLPAMPTRVPDAMAVRVASRTSSGSRNVGQPGSPLRARQVPDFALIEWLRSLADLVEAGVPLLAALTVLRDQRSTRDLSLHAATLAQQGRPLSDALVGYAPPIVHALVRAGEASGQLPEALRNAARFLEDRRRVVQTLRQELGWPFAVTFYTFLVLLFVFMFVVPRFVGLYERLRIALPPLAKMLFAIHQLLREYWMVLLVLALLLGVLGRMRLARLALVRRYYLSLFYWALGTLLRSGIRMVEALEVAGAACGADVIERRASLAAWYIAEGRDVLDTLRRFELVPPDLVVLISGGIAGGRLPEALDQASRLLQRQVEQAFGRVARWLGGTATFLAGASVLALGISVYLPVIQLALSAFTRAMQLQR